MKVLISGATGFIGAHLTRVLLDRGHLVVALTRNTSKAKEVLGEGPQVISDLSGYDGDVEAIVNLAGEPIADKRWSEDRKSRLLSSRIEMTKELVAWCQKRPNQVSCFLSGSAIGYYGASLSDQMLSEDSDYVQGFSHELCAQWEAEALKASDSVARVCIARTGVVLGKGGALSKMLPAFKLGLGGPISSGRQWMSWIDLDDQVNALMFLLEQETAEGVYNLTAPYPVSNAEFSQALARRLSRPAMFTMPGFVPKLMLGEGEELLTKGQRVIPRRLTDQGFVFDCEQVAQSFAKL